MARSEPDFTTRMVPLLVAYARKRGVDVSTFVERVSLRELVEKPGDISSEEMTVSPAALRELAGTMSVALNDVHFGLDVADDVPKGSYGVGEFVTAVAPTVGQVMENFVRFSGILAPHYRFEIKRTDSEVEVHSTTPKHSAGLGPYLNEYALAMQWVALRTMIDVPLRRIWFSTPSTSLEKLTSYFGTSNIAFDQPSTGLSIPLETFDAPNKRGDPALFAFLENLAVKALDARPKSDELVDRLRVLIRDALRDGEPNIERLSTYLNMSARTLQRRLSDVKTSFQDVLDEVRFDLARGFLADTQLDISQVAYLLGYSELRAFDRAFKRWANVAPREWRSQAR